MRENQAQPAFARALILDELFDLSLYRAYRHFSKGKTSALLSKLIAVEERHYRTWQEFFGMRIKALDARRRLKLSLLILAGRLSGERGIHLVLEAIEHYGIRKYLTVWSHYRDTPLGAAVKDILEDEFHHEDEILEESLDRRINPERVRNLFLGVNDGLVEILGAISGFFAAFDSAAPVLAAGVTVAFAGAFSMGAGAFIAANSEKEVAQLEEDKARFSGKTTRREILAERPARVGLIVGAAYLLGAAFPVLPVLFGAGTVVPSVIAAGLLALGVSVILAFLSGMDLRRRLLLNLLVLGLAVAITYLIGLLAKRWLGVAAL